MALRTFVSFEAPFPKAGDPPGSELAATVVAGLRSDGVQVDGPGAYEGWAWTFGSSFEGGGGVFSLLALSDDPPLEWQGHSHVLGRRRRPLPGRSARRLDPRVGGWLGPLGRAGRAGGGGRAVRRD